MTFIELTEDRFHLIQGLWEKLNRLHGERSTHFKDHFASFSFETRLAQFIKKEHKAVFAGIEDDVCVAYIMVSYDHGTGEIDSIYVDEPVRGKGVGTQLMDKALAWFDGLAYRNIRVAVAEGNESAISFYKPFGFYERFTVLQRKP